MTRQFFIERVLRQIYGGQPPQDSNITDNLINSYLNDATAVAAKQCYKEAIQIEGIGYVNNSFYTTFKGIAVTNDEKNLYKLSLPQIPVGIGVSDGVETLVFKDANGNLSMPVIWLTQVQRAYARNMRPMPNKIMAYSEGIFAYVISTIILTTYTASVTLISGGDSTNLNSQLNVPDDYMDIMITYIQKQLLLEQSRPREIANEGQDLGNKD